MKCARVRFTRTRARCLLRGNASRVASLANLATVVVLLNRTVAAAWALQNLSPPDLLLAMLSRVELLACGIHAYVHTRVQCHSVVV